MWLVSALRLASHSRDLTRIDFYTTIDLSMHVWRARSHARELKWWLTHIDFCFRWDNHKVCLPGSSGRPDEPPAEEWYWWVKRQSIFQAVENPYIFFNIFFRHFSLSHSCHLKGADRNQFCSANANRRECTSHRPLTKYSEGGATTETAAV